LNFVESTQMKTESNRDETESNRDVFPEFHNLCDLSRANRVEK